MNLSPWIVCLALALVSQAGWAQGGRHFGPPGGPPARGADRPSRDEYRAPPERRADPGRREERPDRPLSPDERRELRRQIREHGRDLYREQP